MLPSEYIALAVGKWVVAQSQLSNDLACDGLSKLDPLVLFQTLAGDNRFAEAEFSIALAGFGLPPAEIESIARQAGLLKIRSFTDDLHVAAGWRNDPGSHPRSIALASGYNAGVHTLGHYAKPNASELAKLMLEAAVELHEKDSDSPDVHARLLREIDTEDSLEPLRSVEACAGFLSEWDSLRATRKEKAPCFALPVLGLLADPELFQSDRLTARLDLNLKTVEEIKQLRSSALAKTERRVEAYLDPERRESILSALKEVRSFLENPTLDTALTLPQALKVVKPPADEKPAVDEGEEENPGEEDDEKPSSFDDVSVGALLDGRDEDLAAVSDAIEAAWEEFEESSDSELSIVAELPGGVEISTSLPVDRNVLSWVSDFCSEKTWGALIETDETNLHQALRQAADGEPHSVRCDRLVIINGEAHSMEQLLAGWDEDLGENGSDLEACFTEFRTLRSDLLPFLPHLTFHAREWLDGRPEILAKIARYLFLAGKLYRGVQENYRVMSGISHDWARLTLEGLLALDVIQVRVSLPDGKKAAKAVLLPTHPLHLWRNERLSNLLRGLAKTVDLSERDRKVIHQSLKRPEQFLSVIRLGSIPAGKGLGQLLPLADQIEGLPVFENLINACSGLDGAPALYEAINQFILLHPNHPFPLRIAVVNPPRPEALLAGFVKILNDPRYRGGQRLSGFVVDLYASGKHRDRLDAVLGFSDSRNEDLVQEKIASGRLVLNIHDEGGTDSIQDVTEKIKGHPAHLVAVFDESTIHIRRRAVGHLLPMSPFCVRRELKLDRRTGNIAIEPQPGESPFSEFLLLMSELEGNQPDVTPYAHADAESLAETADTLLQGDSPAARWMFLADRALPQESGMNSVKIWERREGHRDTFLAARNFGSLARLLRPVFSKCNLTVTPEVMSTLLDQGARLLGSGLLSMIRKADGEPDEKSVIGFAGLILAARDIWSRHPGCLVLSVDHPVARLWLRTGPPVKEDRCDLLVLRREEEELVLTAVEIKTSLGAVLANGKIRLAHADGQIAATLDAIEDGLLAARGNPQSPLSIPRCEMLKMTLARAAQARAGEPISDRENRRRWGSWLVELFQAEDKLPTVRLEGCAISVLLLRAGALADESADLPNGKPVIRRTLTESDIAALIQVAPDLRASDSNTQDPLLPPPTRPILPSHSESIPSKKPAAAPSSTPAPPVVESQPQPRPPSNQPEEPQNEIWPPPTNDLGMIGQYEAVKRLVEQADYAVQTGRRFSDKLLVGPAGVGKSTLVRRLSRKLLDHEPIFLNGGGLRKPSDIIERLKQENLIPETDAAPISISPCVLFIDEVHGISSQVANALLSAMDDERVTTIDNVLYDLSRVIFLLATTDQGALSEAFQSRPNKTWLSPYTLNELAGIIWMHGRDALEQAELSRGACVEIAARTRCNPRRAVRDLTEILIPHFYSRSKQGDSANHARIAELMTSASLGEFYERQGVDPNGLDNLAIRFMTYLKQHGNASETTLRHALGITHANDFGENDEYLRRLGLVETSSAGRRLTKEGRQYLKINPVPDLRSRISRAMS